MATYTSDCVLSRRGCCGQTNSSLHAILFVYLLLRAGVSKLFSVGANEVKL